MWHAALLVLADNETGCDRRRDLVVALSLVALGAAPGICILGTSQSGCVPPTSKTGIEIEKTPSPKNITRAGRDRDVGPIYLVWEVIGGGRDLRE